MRTRGECAPQNFRCQYWLSCYGTRATCGPVQFVTTAALTVSIFASCSFSRSFTVASGFEKRIVLSKEFIQQHRVYHFVVNAFGLPIRIPRYQS
jgi:hypothetical protein